MAHYCRICKRFRPNEKFSGKGHNTHVCKECSRLPKVERQSIEQKDEITGFLNQSNISRKNIARLKALVESKDPEISELASVVLEVAMVKPHKKRRLKILARERRGLMKKIEDSGLMFAFDF